MKKKRRKEGKEEKKGRKGEKKGRKRREKEGKGGYEDSVGGYVGQFFFQSPWLPKTRADDRVFDRPLDFEKKSPHTTAYPLALYTGKDSSSQPSHNPPSYARKLPVFTELSHF
jgi:hypothetical protein